MSLFGNKKNKKYLPIDYHQKKLENPFFKRKDRITPLTGIKAKLIIIFVGLFLIFIFWFLFISSFLAIKEILITGLEPAATAEIKNLITEQISAKNFIFRPQKNLLFFNDKKLQESIKNKYRFQKIIIQKKWPDKLIVDIFEKPLACVWIENGKYYYVDVDGYIVQEISPLDLNDKQFPLISNESNEKIFSSKIQTNLIYLQAASTIYEKIASSTLGITVDRFIIDNEVDTIKAQISESLKISFDAKGDYDKQLERLFILKTQKLKADFANKTKIDLRFGDKIYYQ